MSKATTKFREVLPDSCPPEDATTNGHEVAYRLIPGGKAVDGHFDSHCAMGKPCPPELSPCRWSSCSLFESRATALKQFKLPKVRKRFSHFAILKIAPGSGYSVHKESGHIDFWMFANFNPVNAITGVEPI